MFPFSFILLALALAAGGLASGVADSAVPGEMLYSVDRAVENLRWQLTSDPYEQLMLKHELNSERLDEIQELSLRSETELVDQALADLEVSIKEEAFLADQVDMLQEDDPPDDGDDDDADDDADDDDDDADDDDDDADDDDDDADDDDDDDADGDGNQGFYCRNKDDDESKRHPKGNKIAEGNVDLEYEDVMGWFCGDGSSGIESTRFGFGEIEKASIISQFLGLSEALDDYTVLAILELRAEGMGWGKIMDELEIGGKHGQPYGQMKKDVKNSNVNGDGDGDGDPEESLKGKGKAKGKGKPPKKPKKK